MIGEFIPGQFKGASADVVSEKECNTAADALQLYQWAKERLFNCNNWHDYAGAPFSEFAVYNEQAMRTNAPVGAKYFIAIDIPGPGKTEGEFDWVQVQYVVDDHKDDDGLLSLFTVRPCSNPLSTEQKTQHFFNEAASSTFAVRLLNNTVYAEVHGRNEEVNDEEPGVWNKLRNWVVAVTGMAGGTSLHWKRLTDGLLKP